MPSLIYLSGSGSSNVARRYYSWQGHGGSSS